MTKKIFLTITFTTLLVFVLLAWAGCGGDSDTVTDSASVDTGTSDTGASETDTGVSTTDTGTSGDLDDLLSEVEDLEATVEVKTDGESVVIWSSKQGSWRWQDPADPSSYVIYNKDKDKLWTVDGNTAQELPGVGVEGSAWWGMSPAAMLQAFTIFPGEKTGDTWEMSIPGGGSVVIELKGPQGLPTKMTSITVKSDGSEETEVIEFIYTDVGSVSDDLFELPSNVTVQEMPDIEGLENIELPNR